MGEIATKKPNKTVLTIYLMFFCTIGVALSAFLIYEYVSEVITAVTNGASLYGQISDIIILSAISTLCRSLPVPSRKGEGSMDISTIIIFAAFLYKGSHATAVVILASTLFSFAKWEGKQYKHIFNIPISQTLFNNSNLTIAMYLGSLVYQPIYKSLFNNSTSGLINLLPTIILPAVVFLLVNMLANSIFITIVFRLLQGLPIIRTFRTGIIALAPTILAFAPIGIFLAIVFELPTQGPFLALLFFIPLMFARYAYKLYLDSKEQYLRTISTLTTAIEAKDEYTEGHSKRVAQYSVEIAQAMKLHGARIENIKVAAMLHDIGKIGIEDEILRKPTKLNDYEWGKIMEHPTIGIKILEEVVMPDAVKDMILYHHIRFDKKGYPQSGRNIELPMEVHIISLADAYDAMTSDRPYRKALSDDVALKIIQEERGTQFHPDVVDEFLNMKKRNHVGT